MESIRVTLFHCFPQSLFKNNEIITNKRIINLFDLFKGNIFHLYNCKVLKSQRIFSHTHCTSWSSLFVFWISSQLTADAAPRSFLFCVVSGSINLWVVNTQTLFWRLALTKLPWAQEMGNSSTCRIKIKKRKEKRNFQKEQEEACP